MIEAPTSWLDLAKLSPLVFTVAIPTWLLARSERSTDTLRETIGKEMDGAVAALVALKMVVETIGEVGKDNGRKLDTIGEAGRETSRKVDELVRRP